MFGVSKSRRLGRERAADLLILRALISKGDREGLTLSFRIDDSVFGFANLDPVSAGGECSHS